MSDPAASPLVTLEAVTKEFGHGRKAFRALDGVDLQIARGEIFAIIGHSGAGKSTLVRLVNGLERVTSGRVIIDGQDITRLSENRLADVRQGIGMVFQQFNLLRSRTVFGNVEFPLIVAGRPKAEREERVWELLDFVGLTQKAHQHPEQLSGGQQQRVSIARALADGPPLLLADEATSALDPETTQDVLDLLSKVNREFGVTIIVITHEMDVVRRIADRVAVLDKGKITEHGAVYDIFSTPQAEPTQRFLRTVVRSRPDQAILDRLRRQRPGRLAIVEVGDDNRIGDVLGTANSRGVTFHLAFGGIEVLQDREFGSITLELTGADAAVDGLLEDLRTIAAVEEVAR